MSSRSLSLLLIGIGALASTATSRPTGWWPHVQQDLAPAVLDQQRPTVRYLVHAELRGPALFEGVVDGAVQAHVVITPRLTPPTGASATIELHALTHPDIAPAIEAFPLPMFGGQYLMLDAFLTCERDPCSEDFELVIHRDPLAALPLLDVSGYVRAYALGTEKGAPDGRSLTVEVEQEL